MCVCRCRMCGCVNDICTHSHHEQETLQWRGFRRTFQIIMHLRGFQQHQHNRFEASTKCPDGPQDNLCQERDHQHQQHMTVTTDRGVQICVPLLHTPAHPSTATWGQSDCHKRTPQWSPRRPLRLHVRRIGVTRWNAGALKY